MNFKIILINKSFFNQALDAYNSEMNKLGAFIYNEPLINCSTSDEEYVHLADHSGEKGKYEIKTGEIIFNTSQ